MPTQCLNALRRGATPQTMQFNPDLPHRGAHYEGADLISASNVEKDKHEGPPVQLKRKDDHYERGSGDEMQGEIDKLRRDKP